MTRSTADHSVFYHHTSSRQCIYLIVYVDDIVITGNDRDDIRKLIITSLHPLSDQGLGETQVFSRD